MAGDGIISLEEWHTLVINSPDIIGYMTLPILNQVRHVLYFQRASMLADCASMHCV